MMIFWNLWTTEVEKNAKKDREEVYLGVREKKSVRKKFELSTVKTSDDDIYLSRE